MKLFKGLTLKMAYGYLAITAISMVVFVVTMVILTSNRNMDKRISETLMPTLILFKDANILVLEIKRLDNSWIYTPTANDKTRLTKIIREEIPIYEGRIKQLASQSSEETILESLNALQKSLERVLVGSNELISKLATDEDYGVDEKVDAALAIYEKQVTPEITETEKAVASTITHLSKTMGVMQAAKNSSFTSLFVSFLAMLIFIIGAGVVSLIISNKIIIEPINKLKEVIKALAKGEILAIAETKSKDEIAEMQNNIAAMLKGFKDNTDFAAQIGEGNYTKEFKPLSEKDELGNALLEMRTNLKKNAEDESKRNWATTGMAKIGELLRKNDLSMTELTDEIIRFVVKYTNSNQGGLFIVEKDERGEDFLALKACYAYERKKYLEKKIDIGMGLVGQCYLEGATVYMTHIPDQYLKITSGLGESNPNCLIIVPLKMNDVSYGVMEVASFNKLEKFQMEFFEKIAESIASSISSVKVNERTKQLLADSQSQSEMLRSQEEEMRQNLEEMQATQEEMNRKEQEYVKRIQVLEAGAAK